MGSSTAYKEHAPSGSGTLENSLAALHRNAAELALARSLEQVYEITLDTIEEVLGFMFAGIAVKDGDKVVYLKTWNSEMPEDWEIPLDAKSVIVRTFKTGEPQQVEDTSKDPDYLGPPEDFGLLRGLSEVTAPILVGEAVVAVINIESPNPNNFTDRDVMLLKTLAQHVSSALIRLSEAEKRKTYEERLSALHSHAVELNSAKTLQDIYECTINAMVETFNYYRVDILRVKDDKLVQVAKYGGIPTDVKLTLDGKGVTVRAIKEKKTILVNDVKQSSDYVYVVNPETGQPFNEFELSSAELASPIIVDGEAIGVLNIESTEKDSFTDIDRQQLEILANHVATAMARLANLEEAKRLSVEQNQGLMEGFRRVSSMARHDLRGPLRNISMAAHILKQSPDKSEMFGIIDSNLKHADNILDDWKELTLRKEITRLRTNVRNLAEEVLRSMIIPDNVETETDIPEDMVYLLDMRGMSRVLTNLITNAIEAMPDGGKLAVRANRDDDGLVITVSDTGKGISAENRDKIFTPFFTTKTTGVGLGLAYVKDTVEAHGGTVEYSDTPGEGASFTIRISSE
jgi:signal transduction histidine kinase